MSRYNSTAYPGVRYREHEERKHNGKPDRYYFIRYKRAGRTVEESVGWASHGMNTQRATKLRAELVQNIREGKHPQSLQEKRDQEQKRREGEQAKKEQEALHMFTFGQLAERYMEWAKANKKSWRDDEQRYQKHLSSSLGSRPLREIVPLHLEKLKHDLGKKGLSPATVKHCLVLVRHMFNKATAWDLFEGQNPINKVKFPKLNNRRIRFLSHEEASLLLAELAKRSQQVHDQALLSLLSGLRFGEIAALTWADADLTHGTLAIRSPKNGEGRQAFMTEEVKTMLSARKPEGAGAQHLIFPDRKGNMQKSVSDAFERAVEKLGFNEGITESSQKLVFHSLRHTFASWLAIDGAALYTIKELMGHKTLTMTERYAHLIPDHKHEAVNGLARGFRSARGE